MGRVKKMITMRNSNFDVPILFLIFNRPDLTSIVFDSIKKIKPTKLFIAADGPRGHVNGEKAQCEKTREIVNGIDWPCEVKTLFRETNLGCKRSVSQSISWFFDQVEQGIILEDDCLPDESFFRYCQESLDLYKDDERIMQISGFNALINTPVEESYYFSKFGPIWGWASWRRAWKYYDVNLDLWQEVRRKPYIEGIYDTQAEKNWRESILDRVYKDKIDTWDYQWAFAKFINSGLTIVPKVNLIRNIGFGPAATHTTHANAKMNNFPVENLNFPLIHPLFVLRNKKIDLRYINEVVFKNKLYHLKNFLMAYNPFR
jgi:hypothetical protein